MDVPIVVLIFGLCAASRATWCGGAGMRRRTTSGCGWRSWRTARRRWRSTTPPPRAAASRGGPGPRLHRATREGHRKYSALPSPFRRHSLIGKEVLFSSVQLDARNRRNIPRNVLIN